jgi:hypothetical protein
MSRNFTKTLLAACILAACNTQPQQSEANLGSPTEVAPDLTITCQGIGQVSFQRSRAELEALFSSEVWDFGYNEMDEVYFTSLFPDQPEEVLIEWLTGEPDSPPAMISINRAGSPYQFENGVKIGTSIQELNNLNGRPFRFDAFSYETLILGGAQIYLEKNKDKLHAQLGCFVITLQASEPVDDYDDFEKLYAGLQGEGELQSDMPEAARLQVAGIYFLQQNPH